MVHLHSCLLFTRQSLEAFLLWCATLAVVWCAGAYVILQSAKDAAKAVQLLRQEKGITAMTYADYANSKGHSSQSSSSSSSGASTARPVPQSISVVEAVSSMPTAADSMRVVEDLRAAAAAKSAEKQAQEQIKAEQQQQQQQQADADVESYAMREPLNAATSDGQELPGQQSGAEIVAADSNDSSSSSSTAQRAPVDVGGAALQSTQQLRLVQQLQRPVRPQPVLQRPTMRPMPQRNSS
jgi:hypothetical protein